MAATPPPGCIARLVALLRGAAPATVPSTTEVGGDGFPFRRRADFLSPAERDFCRALQVAVGSELHICAKVGLGDLFFVADERRHPGARNRISRKHVDFVLLDPVTLHPALAIELDDSSHNRPDRQASDRFKDELFAGAGLPLLRVRVRATFDPAEIAAQIRAALPVALPGADGGAWALPPWLFDAEPLPATAGAVPLCPACALPMVRRVARRGPNAGRPFFGCPNFPRCAEIVDAVSG